MTQPAPQTATPPGPLQIPKAKFPTVTRVISASPFSSPTVAGILPDTELVWIVNQNHPIMPELTIKRMYALLGMGVEVYSTPAGGEHGVRHTLPWGTVRMVEEVMDPTTFVEELADAEKSEDDPEPGEGDLNGVS